MTGGLRSGFLAFLLLSGQVSGAVTLSVDWLEFRPESGLSNDAGLVVGEVLPDVESGVLFPGSPGGGRLDGGFWQEATVTLDSITGDETLQTVTARVAPGGGTARYTIDIRLSAQTDLVVAVGQLFKGGGSSSSPVGVTPLVRAGGGVPRLEFLGSFGWDNGVSAFDAALEWNAAGRALEFAPGASGESEFAFLRLRTSGADIQGLRLELPDGYGEGAGDTIEFAVGLVVPEPSLGALSVPALAILMRRRRIAAGSPRNGASQRF